MPITTFQRLWCKPCQEWRLFHKAYKEGSELCCQQCQTPFDESTKLGDIPPDKIEEQRQRYRQYRLGGITNMVYGYLRGEFSSSPQKEIIESDAGLLFLEKKQEQRREQIKAEKKALREKYAGVGRNEPCPCGSGKKYKACHLAIVKEAG